MTSQYISNDAGTELSSRRTGMSFQRTRMSADRTLMSILRTSLSLISFGFTIYQFLGKLRDSAILTSDGHAARNFGTSLVSLGVLMLIVGIAYHLRFMHELRAQRQAMVRDGLLHGQSTFPLSVAFMTAVLLLLIGLAAVSSMVFRIGPFN